MEKRVHSALPTAGLAITLVVLALLAAAPLARAQEGGDNPPEILTSDLALKTVLESDRLEVNFVIVDTDKVTRVTIDGDEQSFEPADTVMLSRNFVFHQDVTRVRVSATDEAGHTRTVVYTVFRPGVDVDQAAPAEAAEGRIFANYDVRLEYDTNPSNEISFPVKVGDFEVKGGEDDVRLNVDAYGGFSKGNLVGFVGGRKIEYSDDLNAPFELQLIYAGGILALPRGETANLLLGYMFADVNIANGDYAQLHILSLGYRAAGATDDGGTGTTLYQVDVNPKQFAADTGLTNTTVWQFRWEYESRDKAKLDEYRRRVFLGGESEGTDISVYKFVGADWRWKNRWDSGLAFDIELAIDYRGYDAKAADPDTPLGADRVDIPMRVAPSIGWQFSPKMRVMAHYEYKFNLSNAAPYVRQLIGIGVDGRF